MVWGRNVYAYALPPGPLLSIRLIPAALPQPAVTGRKRYLERICNESYHICWLASHGMGDAIMGCGYVADVDVSRTTNRGSEL